MAPAALPLAFVVIAAALGAASLAAQNQGVSIPRTPDGRKRSIAEAVSAAPPTRPIRNVKG
jgi:hypothetical protein